MSALLPPSLPSQIWLDIALYLEFNDVIQLSTVNKDSYQLFSKSQYFWKRYYAQTFSHGHTELFWMTAYRTRLAQRLRVHPENVKVDWRHAYMTRRQTEINWRLGRGVERSCVLSEAQKGYT
jgi:hypothetical protein